MLALVQLQFPPTRRRTPLMSEGVSQGKGCLELKIFVRYEGLKATQYFSKFTSESGVVLREDLLALKLPHPKRANTTFISYGYVECLWPMVPKYGVRGCQKWVKKNIIEMHFFPNSFFISRSLARQDPKASMKRKRLKLF